VLGLEAVLASGEVIRTGGKQVKLSSGYDLTQLIVGSEGTLALVTEATLRLYPRLPCQATLLAPFGSLAEVTAAVPQVVASGAAPLILEYIDARTMAVIAQGEDLDLGIPGSVRESAQAYLVVMQEERDPGRLDADVADVAELLARVGAADVYVLPAAAARRLVEAREKAFWAAKRAGRTTSSTRSCPARRWPPSWARWRGSAPGTTGWCSAPATPVTATCTSRCSSPTTPPAAR
jgi:glycolate dehydrogenase FAD-linked subunit